MARAKITFGAKLKQQREALGLSQAQFAKKVGVNVVTVSRWERNLQVPQRAMCNALQTYFTDKKFRKIIDSVPPKAGPIVLVDAWIIWMTR